MFCFASHRTAARIYKHVNQLERDPLRAACRCSSQATKLQHNAGGGGCFPMHFDSDETLDGRRVTAIFYLNDRWAPGDGGELKLYPLPHAPVTLPPLADRMVLFSSTRMLHRVLPSAKARHCFTVWLAQNRRCAVAEIQSVDDLLFWHWRCPRPSSVLQCAKLIQQQFQRELLVYPGLGRLPSCLPRSSLSCHASALVGGW